MSLNLLSLAKSSGAGLHNSGRGRGKSYASGTTYGNKIAGTNIKQGAGLVNLAKKGRTSPISGKDTKIRKVAGKPSHVNKLEASVIDKMGPLGEAWVQKVGSGAINPKTGLPEYGWFSDVVSWIGDRTGLGRVVDETLGAIQKGWEWLTPSGHTQWFSHEDSFNFTAEQNEIMAKARHKNFEEWRRKYEQENIAGIWTPEKEGIPSDDSSKIIAGGWDSGGNEGFESFIGNSDTPSGLVNPTEPSSNAIADYMDPYDPRAEEELGKNYVRDMSRIGLNTQSAFTQDILSQKKVGQQLSSGLFGMLTQSSDKKSQQGFAGAGDFNASFAQQQAIKDAELQVLGGKDAREKKIEEMKITTEQATDDLASDVKDLHDQYNQEFWNNAVTWDSAINA